MTNWNEWITCSKSCGGGSKSRNRNILAQQEFGGTKCNSTIDTTECNTTPCPGEYVVNYNFEPLLSTEVYFQV